MLRFSSAYGRIRKQFGLPIARMEGIEEPLARMIETAYACEAARAVTAAMVTRGERPSVISALMKYQTTERMRRAVNDAFDIHGGRAICDGPSSPIDTPACDPASLTLTPLMQAIRMKSYARVRKQAKLDGNGMAPRLAMPIAAPTMTCSAMKSW